MTRNPRHSTVGRAELGDGMRQDAGQSIAGATATFWLDR
jgi:hypothetical protein